MNPKGKRYLVQPGFSISTRRGLVRSGGWVWENDFPEGNLDKVLERTGKPKLVADPEKPLVIEYPPKEEKPVAKKSVAKRKTVAKKKTETKAAEKKTDEKPTEKNDDEKPSFVFGRK